MNDRNGNVLCKKDRVIVDCCGLAGYGRSKIKYGTIDHFHSNDYGDQFAAIKVDESEWGGCLSRKSGDLELL